MVTYVGWIRKGFYIIYIFQLFKYSNFIKILNFSFVITISLLFPLLFSPSKPSQIFLQEYGLFNTNNTCLTLAHYPNELPIQDIQSCFLLRYSLFCAGPEKTLLRGGFNNAGFLLLLFLLLHLFFLYFPLLPPPLPFPFPPPPCIITVIIKLLHIYHSFTSLLSSNPSPISPLCPRHPPLLHLYSRKGRPSMDINQTQHINLK